MSSTPLLRTERKRSLLLPTLAGGALVAIGALSSQRHSSSRSPPELYNKKETYGKSYGQLAGDDAVQKSWPGATCARSDDDKWGWGEPKATADNSGTNCVYGDSWFCEEHYDRTDDGEMTKISDLLWYYCNSTCNSTDENRVSAYGSDAVLEGSSMLAGCAFDGLKNMPEVCRAANTSRFEPMRRAVRRLSNNVAPSLNNSNGTVVYINQTWAQAGCNSHAMCSECLVNATTGELDKYCEAFLAYYSFADAVTADNSVGTPLYSVELFWYNVHFWCQTDVLDAIADGTFVDKLRAGDIYSATQIRVAVNNSEELKWWGTTDVVTDDDDDDA